MSFVFSTEIDGTGDNGDDLGISDGIVGTGDIGDLGISNGIFATTGNNVNLGISSDGIGEESKVESLQHTSDFLNADDYLVDLQSDMKRNLNKREKQQNKAKKQLPEGWEKVPSRSRPGKFSYLNKHTGERTTTFPKLAAKTLEEQQALLIEVDYNGKSTFKVNCGVGKQSFKWLLLVAKQQYERSHIPHGRLRQREIGENLKLKSTNRHRFDRKKNEKEMKVYKCDMFEDQNHLEEPFESHHIINEYLDRGDKVIIR